MSSALPVLAGRDARRVIAAAALMTSDKDGEALAAVRATCRLLAPHNIGPADVFRLALGHEVQPRREAFSSSRRAPSGYPRPLNERVRLARHSPHINDWERDFLNSMIGRRSFSPREEAKLKDILRKSEGSGQ